MRRRNSRVLLFAFFLLAITIWAQGAPAPQTTPTQEPTVQAPAADSGPPASNSSSNQPAAQQQGQPPASEDNSVFVFKKEVEEVALHATVVDDKQHLITNLDKSAFTVYENNQPQTITSFRHEDIPVAMGIVIDNSGSMREKREKVNKAAVNLVRSSNPQDQVFIVNFNDEYYLDQDFTNDLLKLKEALEKIDARGGTALFDAVDSPTLMVFAVPSVLVNVTSAIAGSRP